MDKVVELTKELQRVMYSTTYSFEIDTEDVVFGFKKTLKKRTKSLVKALQLERKLRSDVGRYISSSVRIVAVRMYNNGVLKGEFKS
ncbi:hypothetical protein MUN53_14440 [Parabacteroides sp. AGMB00274]|uniref:Uncharacterized protein n=1 Tax=Parabacteroides faecalis TaxID=2924040 RepID=A0ABT0C459_9BACT|nr:hypothetical protein [Parabacteroides faecalis]MCJ2381788.1 hypothetical protein [Parabacteroides faecalis]